MLLVTGNKDWASIHQKNFNKMQSIDAYLAKKRQRTATLSASVKKAHMMAMETKSAVEKLKSHTTPTMKVNPLSKENLDCLTK